MGTEDELRHVGKQRIENEPGTRMQEVGLPELRDPAPVPLLLSLLRRIGHGFLDRHQLAPPPAG